MRLVDVIRGEFLLFKCSALKCRSISRVELPEIRKKIVYLDTSVVSGIGRAQARGDDGRSPYIALFEALRDAVAQNLIVCPSSSIVEAEAELMPKYADAIINVGKVLGDPGMKDPLFVQQAQLGRALRMFLEGTPASPAADVQLADVLPSEVHKWHSVCFPVVRIPTRPEFIDGTRIGKLSEADEARKRYRYYADQGLSFKKVAKIESSLWGVTLVGDGNFINAAKRAVLEGRITDARVSRVLTVMPTISKFALLIEDDLNCSSEEAYHRAAEFLMSDHAAATPYARIRGLLHAELAMRFRSTSRVNGRQPEPSDGFDVEHMATFVPYVDVFVADNFMATIANHGHLKLGENFGAHVRSISKSGVSEFVKWLKNLADESAIAELSRRIDAAVDAGGVHDDFVARMRGTPT